MTKTDLSWKFPRVFWVANLIELFERAAYYGMFIALSLYLTNEVKFTDVEAGWVAAFFAGFLYLMPTFTGAIADNIGFRNGLLLSFALLTGGYALLGAFQLKLTAVLSLFLILLGGSFVKPIIAGTVAKASDEKNRARAFSIFYQIVNIGAFTGKLIAKPLRTDLGLMYINFYSAAMAGIAFILIFLFYRNLDTTGMGKTLKETLHGFITVLKNARFMILILIVAGFWTIQGQLYATMPKYALRLIGPGAAPEWLANVNPFVVVLFVVPVTQFVRKLMPVSSIAIALLIIPFSALSISLSPLLENVYGNSISFGFFAMHPITVMLIIGIALQGFAECFLSPRYYEFASNQAPPSEVGLYMGYSQIHTFFAWLIGFAISGYLLDAYCPDPQKMSDSVRAQLDLAIVGQGPMPLEYAHAHHIWYYFAAIGFFAFFCLLVYKYVTTRLDRVKNNPDFGRLSP